MANAVLHALLARARSRASEPVVTFLSERGERTELSAVTLLIAVAKSANLLRDSYDVEPGTPVSLTIPWHWQRAPWLIACLAIGADVRLEQGAALEVGSVASLAESAAADRLAVSLHPFGLPIADLPVDLVDASSEARLQPDAFIGEDADTASWLADATVRGRDWSATDRVLAEGDGGWSVLLTPLATPAALVMCERTGDADREGITQRW